MEPNNIENQFRQKLNDREIQPSRNSWDRLDAMLTVADLNDIELAKQKPKRNLSWLYIAAGFLGFILIATVFFSQTEELIDVERQEVVIEQNSEEVKQINQKEVIKMPSQKKANEAVVVHENPQKNQSSKSKVVSKKQEVTQKTLASNILNNEISNSNQNISERASSINNINTSKSAIKVNAESLLASVETQKPTTLLSTKQAVVKVNSNDLLAQVDTELEQSFREKVLQSVNKKYQEVKVAVVNRNFQ